MTTRRSPEHVRRISLAERAESITPIAGRRAAVAVPVVPHPAFGPCLVVTRRSRLNGHTGRRISYAGNVVLFGGSVQQGETPEQAALRELCEESGTLHLLEHGHLAVRDHLGTWMTESGLLVEGYTVDLPSTFVDTATPDTREVAEIAYLRVDDLRSATATLEYHPVDARDHGLGPEHGVGSDHRVEFESPTIQVLHPVTGRPWELWGLAGFMVDRWLQAGQRISGG